MEDIKKEHYDNGIKLKRKRSDSIISSASSTNSKGYSI